MLRIKATITDKDKGFKRRVAELGGLGAITLGIQGADAAAQHPESTLSFGELGAIHELGIGVPERSWLRKWIDQNQARMAQEARRELILIADGKSTRKKSFERLGFQWTTELRDNIYQGKITPPLSPAYKNRTGMPLFDSGMMASKITYVVYLEPTMRRRGKFASERQAARDALGADSFADTLPAGAGAMSASFPRGTGAAPSGTVRVPGSPQPAPRPPTPALPGVRGGRKHQGPMLPNGMGGGFFSKRARKHGPRMQNGLYNSKGGRKYAGPMRPGGGFWAKKFGPRVPKGFKRIRMGAGGYMGLRRGKSTNMLLWLIRKAAKLARKGKNGDFRNHGFTKSGKGGRTGRRGFKK